AKQRLRKCGRGGRARSEATVRSCIPFRDCLAPANVSDPVLSGCVLQPIIPRVDDGVAVAAVGYTCFRAVGTERNRYPAACGGVSARTQVCNHRPLFAGAGETNSFILIAELDHP